MNNRANWQVGGITTVIGGVGAIVVNILHPPPPARTDELLTLVASVPYWTIMHYLAALAAVSIVSGLALLVRSLQDARAHALGEVGKYVTTLGGAAFLVAIMVDGQGFPYLAQRWMAASGDEQAVVLWAADAVHTLVMALFPVWAGMFMGLGLLLVAVALWQSAEYARIVAAVGIIGASMCLVQAVSAVLGFTVPLPLWPVGPAINAVWITLLGGLMLRKAWRTARASAAAPCTRGDGEHAQRGTSTPSASYANGVEGAIRVR
jgi:hypothetical protein